MKGYFQNKLKKLDKHTLEVVKKSFYSTIVKVAGIAIGVGVSIALGRLLGADGLGVIDLANRIINILLVVGLLGMRQVIIKEIAIAHRKKNYKHIGDVMYSASWLNGVITTVVSLLFIFLAPWLSENIFNESRLTYPLIVFLLALTPQVFSRIFSSGLVGYRKIWQSNLVEQTLSTAIAALLLLFMWFWNFEISINKVAIIYLFGRLIVTISVSIYWNKLYEKKQKREIIIRPLLNISTPLFISTLSTIFIANSDSIFLGIFTNSTEIGLYSVAVKIALLTSFLLQITNSVLGPKIAALYESGQLVEVQTMIQKVTKGLFVLGLIPVFIFSIYGKLILGLWGPQFIEAYYILIIVSIGQLINIGTGAVGQLLIMTGFEKQNRNIMLIFVLFNLILNLFLIKVYGVLGAAIANTLTVSGVNLTRVWVAKKRTGISTI